MSRDVKFKLTTEVDPKTREQLVKYGDEVAKAGTKAQKEIENVGKKLTESMKKAGSELKAVERQLKTLAASATGASKLTMEMRALATATALARKEQERLNAARAAMPSTGGGVATPAGRPRNAKGQFTKGGGKAGAVMGLLSTGSAMGIGQGIGLDTGFISGIDGVFDMLNELKKYTPQVMEMVQKIGGPKGIAKIGGALAATGAILVMAHDLAQGEGKFDPNSISGKVFGNKKSIELTGAADLYMGNTGTAAAQAVQSGRDAEKLRVKTERQMGTRAAIDSNIAYNEEERLRYLEQIQAIEDRIADRTKSVLAEQKRFFGERRQYAEQILGYTQRELKAVHDRIAAEKKAAEASIAAKQSQMMTNVERFGLMDDSQQRRMIDLLKHARGGGQLSTDQLRELQGLGTVEAQKIVSQQARQRASAAFGSEQAGFNYGGMENLEADLEKQKRKIIQNAHFDRNSKGEALPNKFFSRREKQAINAIDSQLSDLRRGKIDVINNEEERQMTRSSVFDGDRGAIANAQRQGIATMTALNERQMMIEAKLKQDINVIVTLDKTAKAVAEETTFRIAESVRPQMDELRMHLNHHAKMIDALLKTRKMSGGN